MTRTSITSLALIVCLEAVPAFAQTATCPAAGTVYRYGCPSETLVDCNYDSSQCDNLYNVDPTYHTLTKWEKKKITWANVTEYKEPQGTGQCAVKHNCDGTFNTAERWPVYEPPVVDSTSWS